MVSLTTVTISSDNTDPELAKIGDTVTILFTSDAAIQNVAVNIGGEVADTITNIIGDDWSAERALLGDETEGLLDFTIDFEDSPGGTPQSQVTAVTDASSVTTDFTNPVATVTGNTSVSSGEFPVEVTFTFSENVTGFDITDVVVTNGTTSNFAGADDTYTVDISPTASPNTITVKNNASSCLDLTGNECDVSNTLTIIITDPDTIAVSEFFQRHISKIATYNAQLGSKVKEAPITVTFGASDNYTTNGTTIDLTLGGRLKTIIDVTPISNNKAVIMEYSPAAENAAATGKLKCYGIDTDASGGAVVGFPELANGSTTVNSMVAKLMVRGY
jgi:hypothetical protein